MLQVLFTAAINYIWSWFTPFWITIYVLSCTLCPWYAIYKCRFVVGTPELNEKYHSFANLHYKYWSWWKVPIYNFFVLQPVRFVVGWGIIIFYVIII